MNERILCLDIGDVRIGVAVSDPTRTIASPVEVIRRVGWGPDVRRIQALCAQYDTNLILSGLPLNMDGSEGFQAAKVRDFCSQLVKAGLQVFFQDERLSTVSAEDALLEGDLSRSDRKNRVDKVAAAVILRQWLDQKNEAKGDASMDKDNLYENNPENENPEEDDELVELVDEDGQSSYFQHIGTFPMNGKDYIAVVDPEDDSEDLNVIILRIDQDENGDDVYVTPDEDEADAAFDIFVDLYEAENGGDDED